MKISQQIILTFLITFYFTATLLKGQSIPVGTSVLEDFYRRAQLLGQIDSSISFTSRPFFPVDALKLKLDTGYLSEVINKKEREAAGEAAPAKGLFLYKVKY